jgi:hypothetical protein
MKNYLKNNHNTSKHSQFKLGSKSKNKKIYFNKNNGHGLKQLPDKAGPFPGIKGYDFSYILHTICANFLKTIIFFYI